MPPYLGLLNLGLLNPERPRGGLLNRPPPLTPEERNYWMLRRQGEHEQARRRIQEGNAWDTDFYISPFAPDRFHEGPVGPGGLGFGVPSRDLGDQALEREPPHTPDRAIIPPETLQWLRALWGI